MLFRSTSTGNITLGGDATLADGVTLTLGRTGTTNTISTQDIVGTASSSDSNLTISTNSTTTINGNIGTDFGTIQLYGTATTFIGTVSTQNFIHLRNTATFKNNVTVSSSRYIKMMASSTMIVATASSAADITINARVHAEHQNNSSTLQITNTGSGDDSTVFSGANGITNVQTIDVDQDTWFNTPISTVAREPRHHSIDP